MDELVMESMVKWIDSKGIMVLGLNFSPASCWLDNIG